MKLPKDLFSVSLLSKESVRIIRIRDDQRKKEVQQASLEPLPDVQTYLVLLSNDNIEVNRAGRSYYLFSAGITAERILTLAKKEGKSSTLIMAFDEEKVRKACDIPRFMQIICITAINDNIETEYKNVYDECWEKRD